MRCTVLGLTSNLAAVLRTLMPPARAALIRSATLSAISWPTEAFTFTLGPLKASANTFLNNRAFELGKNPEHLKHGLACRRGRIETLLMQKEIDAERVKLGQERHKVFQAAPKAIDVPGHQNVELALGGVPAQRIERRPSIAALGAADAVIFVDFGHLPASAFCRLTEFMLLIGRGLV
jgi:hypothetical protein